MSVVRKTRLISFRLSEGEYNELKNLCLADDSRNLSDLARAALNQLISSQQGSIFPEQSSANAIRRLTKTMQNLDDSINRLSVLVEKKYSRAAKPPETRVDDKGKTPIWQQSGGDESDDVPSSSDTPVGV